MPEANSVPSEIMISAGSTGMVTVGQVFSTQEIENLSRKHRVPEEVTTLIAEMIRIVEARRMGLKP